jgi:thioredoxin 1
MGDMTFETSDADFQTQVLDSELPVLIEFTADWCPPCKMIAPYVHDIAHKYAGKLRVGLLDSDDNQATVMGYGVMGLPTLILFVGGEAVERITGFVPQERIEAKVLPHLALENA